MPETETGSLVHAVEGGWPGAPEIVIRASRQRTLTKFGQVPFLAADSTKAVMSLFKSFLLCALMTMSSSVFGALVGYWKLDEGAGSTILDSSGMGNHGQLIN